MIEDLLKERGKTHGDFEDNAHVSQVLKCFVRDHIMHELTDVQAEALEVICAKIARILTGDPNHIDSWVDIAGYATLVVKDIEEKTYELPKEETTHGM